MLITSEAVIAPKFKKPKAGTTNPHQTIPGIQQHMANRAKMGRDVMDAMIDEELEESDD